MTVLDSFPENRFVALEEVQSLLGFRRFEFLSFLKVLSKADGIVEFSLGDMAVGFMINKMLGQPLIFNHNVAPTNKSYSEAAEVLMSIKLEREKFTKEVTYRFSIREIKLLGSRKQLEIESVEGD